MAQRMNNLLWLSHGAPEPSHCGSQSLGAFFFGALSARRRNLPPWRALAVVRESSRMLLTRSPPSCSGIAVSTFFFRLRGSI